MWKKIISFSAIIWMASPAYSAELKCMNTDPSQDNCQAIDTISEVTQLNEIITVLGKPSTYVDNTMYSIYLYDRFLLRYIPTKLFQIFPNVREFFWSNNSLSNLVTDNFINCASLKTIQITKANIINVPIGFAQTCSNIEMLMLSECGIETIDSNAFKGLSSLKTLGLPSNKLSCIPPDLFKNTPDIDQIHLNSNQIKFLDPTTFTGLKRLSNVLMPYNSLSSLPLLDLTETGTWYYNLNFEFSSNQISAITPDILSLFSSRPSNSTLSIMLAMNNCTYASTFSAVGTTNYQSIGNVLQPCHDNWQPSMATPPICPLSSTVTTVPPTSLATTITPPTSGTCPSDKVCRYFLDQYNRYTCILDGVDSLLTSIAGTHLITFDDLTVRRVVFTNSFLLRIPPILFQKFPNLEYLTASNSSMSSINTKTFSTTCGNLKFFDASYNDITSVDGASFKSCSKIEVVDLTGNQFSSIDGQLFINNPTLKNIYINRPPSMVLL